ncbi:pyridoxal phosphate-dependent decarboxylase family protein [Rhizobium laguerreae]|uniref:pyridoxal phosphate-dependent decarboxylase family protein n=1 Tax=Rhizobium laguerreae TaxID=1076926 RepID=UPI001440EC88|nr:pyridoxal-dependent decarboxylase [Rhizobium laguerreae]NKN12286.1 decarboxylase [Rhizobium laguerreae]
MEAWFLGPKAENADLFERLIVDAIRDQAHWRRNFHPDDPTHITEEIKRSPAYLEAVGSLKDNHQSLLSFLKKSVPFFSMRYQGHMNWELTLPAMLGYFSAMLYNPNNVAFEGSTATTILELLVGDDICRMLGYEISGADAPRPWGHITCDGTVANIEAVWAARNVKLYPLAVQEALRTDSSLAGAAGIEIATSGGDRRLVDLDPWDALNLRADDILALPGRLQQEFGIPGEDVGKAIARFSVQTLGLVEFHRRFLRDLPSPVLFVPGTKHYSFPKAAALLGIGAENLRDVPVDLDARLDVDELRKMLEECLREKRAVYTAVCVIGSTEESAVDPVDKVLKLREEMRFKGLEFTVHADSAWGGYHASVDRDDFDMPARPGFAPPPPAMTLGKYVTRQFRQLGKVDSITVDPHKSGYIPYPAGALCYRNSAMRDLVSFSAPVVFHGDAEPTVGIYGVEGSKPGAAVAAVYLSHKVIRPSKSGYGKIIGQALFSCRKLYARLLSMAKESDAFVVVPLNTLPKIDGRSTDEINGLLRDVDAKTGQEIEADRKLLDFMSEIGPDQNILAYAFNLKNADGTVNTSLDLCNRFNKSLYERLSIDPGDDIYGYDLIVSTTDLDAEQYGNRFIDDYKNRLSVGGSPGGRITVLRSVVMNPWLTDTPQGSFIDVLENEFRKALTEVIGTIRGSYTRGI